MASITGQAIREELERWGLIALLAETDAASTSSDRLRDQIRLKSLSLASTAFDGAFVRFPDSRVDSGTTVDGSHNASTTTLAVADGTAVTDEDIIIVDDEWMHVTSIAANNLTVVRGFAGSTAASHEAGAAVTRALSSGFQSRVDRLDQDNGDLYLSPSHPTTVNADNQVYEIWAHGVDPDDADRARDKGLTKICSQWASIPLSEVPNADYELALASSNWESDGNATIAIATLSFPSEFARNSLTVTSTAGVDEYAESASMYVQPGEDFYLYVPVSARGSTTAEVIVFDVTGTAEITLSGTTIVTGRGFTGIEVTFTTPSGCFEITIRLNNLTGSGSISEWGPVNLHRQGQTRIGLPSRVDSRNYVGPIYFLRNFMATGNTDWGKDKKEEVPGVRVEQVGDAVQVRLDNGMIDAPYFYSERFFYTALSAVNYFDLSDRSNADAATTLCPLDYIVAAMVRLLAEQYVNRPGQDREFWVGLHEQALADLARFEREFGPQPQPRQERARTVLIPQERV